MTPSKPKGVSHCGSNDAYSEFDIKQIASTAGRAGCDTQHSVYGIITAVWTVAVGDVFGLVRKVVATNKLCLDSLQHPMLNNSPQRQEKTNADRKLLF